MFIWYVLYVLMLYYLYIFFGNFVYIVYIGVNVLIFNNLGVVRQVVKSVVTKSKKMTTRQKVGKYNKKPCLTGQGLTTMNTHGYITRRMSEMIEMRLRMTTYRIAKTNRIQNQLRRLRYHGTSGALRTCSLCV
jgi:hypothetical protein